MKHIPVCQNCWQRLFSAITTSTNPAAAQALVLERQRYGHDAVLMKFGEKCTICSNKQAAEQRPTTR
jgi:tRNA U54 and U55 pseudouridine synthase Pus10